MSKLKLKKPVFKSKEVPGNIQLAAAVLERTATVEELRLTIESFSAFHPYLAMCEASNFTDEGLLERQEEVIGVLAKAIVKAFGAVKSSVVAAAGSSKGIPAIAQWMGFGTTWGGVAAWGAWYVGGEKAFEALANATNVRFKGVADRDTVNEKRSSMPANATMKVDKGVWVGPTPLTASVIESTVNNHLKLTDSIIRMASSVNAVLKGGTTVDSWISGLGTNSTGKTAAGAYATPTLHKNVGFVIYRNNTKLFLEKVVATKPVSTKAVVPTTMDMMLVQKACRSLIAKTTELEKSVRKAVTKLPTEVKESSGDQVFAANALVELGKGLIDINTALLKDCQTYITDGIGAIMSARVEEPKTPDKAEDVDTPVKPDAKPEPVKPKTP